MFERLLDMFWRRPTADDDALEPDEATRQRLTETLIRQAEADDQEIRRRMHGRTWPELQRDVQFGRRR